MSSFSPTFNTVCTSVPTCDTMDRLTEEKNHHRPGTSRGGTPTDLPKFARRDAGSRSSSSPSTYNMWFTCKLTYYSGKWLTTMIQPSKR